MPHSLTDLGLQITDHRKKSQVTDVPKCKRTLCIDECFQLFHTYIDYSSEKLKLIHELKIVHTWTVNWTGPRGLKGMALQQSKTNSTLGTLKMYWWSLFYFELSQLHEFPKFCTQNADSGHMRNTHLPHTRISPSVHVLGYKYLKEYSVCMSPSVQALLLIHYCIHHSCATPFTAAGFTTHLSYPLHAASI